jgi:hypothetical protein
LHKTNICINASNRPAGLQMRVFRRSVASPSITS